MTDHTKPTGNSGIMLIRDLGNPATGNYVVEFWINANNSTTFNHQLPWSFVANGTPSANLQYRYEAGMSWARLGSVNQWTSGNVTFKLGDTGTSGFGGPTTFTVFINRATVPPAPSPVRYSNLTSTSVTATFDSNGDGGSTLFKWQFGYGTDPNTPQNIIDSLITHDFIGLTSGVTYYFWARGVNAQGNGAWSTRTQVTMLRVPDTPNIPSATNITQISTDIAFTPNGNGGANITSYQVGYNTDPTVDPSTSMLATSPTNVSGLNPATTYYFRVRAQNSVGWSPWSPAIVVRTIAGARIKVGTEWKEAVPYVKVSGVWKLARPWTKAIGIWKETQ